MGLFHWESVPDDFPLVGLHTISINFFLCTCECPCFKVVCEFECWATYFMRFHWGPKLILAPLGMPTWVWPPMNWYRMFVFIQTFTLPPSVHRKLTEHRRCWMDNNKLSTKSHVELEDNPITFILPLSLIIHFLSCEAWWRSGFKCSNIA